MSKRGVIRQVRRSLRSMVVPGVCVFVKRVTVDNGDWGVRRCLHAEIWDRKEGMRNGLRVWTWDDKEFLWECLQALYDYKKGSWIKSAR